MNNDTILQAIGSRGLKELDSRFIPALPDTTGLGVAMQIMTIGYTLAGTLFYVNQGYARFFERYPEELVGKNMAWCLSNSDVGMVLRSVSALTNQSPSKSLSHGVIRPDGSESFQLWLHMAKFSEAGEVLYFQAAGLELNSAQPTIANPESVLRQHLQRNSGIIGSGESSVRGFTT